MNNGAFQANRKDCVRSIFDIYDPIGLLCRTQLMLVHSKYNVEKFKHSFRDTINPMCLTNNGIEDTKLCCCCALPFQNHVEMFP